MTESGTTQIEQSHTTQIDYNHPLFLQPSDTPGAVLIELKLTGPENYTLWSRSLTIALLGKNKVGFIDEIAPKLVSSIVLASTAKKVWEDFKERFDKLNFTRAYQLWREIATHAQGTDSVTTYFSKMKDYWDELDLLVPTPPTCDYAESGPYIAYLNNQPYAVVVQEENQRTLGVVDINRESLSLFAGKKQVQNYKPKKPGNNAHNAPGDTCRSCGYKGHLIEDCYRNVGHPADFKSKKKMHRTKGRRYAHHADDDEPSINDGHYLLNMDSGASHHITSLRKVLNDLKLVDKNTSYADTQKGYKLFELDKKSTFVSRSNVSFRECLFPFKGAKGELDHIFCPNHFDPSLISYDYLPAQEIMAPVLEPQLSSLESNVEPEVGSSSTPDSVVEVVGEPANYIVQTEDAIAEIHQPDYSIVHGEPRRTLRSTKPPIWMQDYVGKKLRKTLTSHLLYPILDFNSYVALSPAYRSYLSAFSAWISPTEEKKVRRLVKSLYGLKKASRQWNIKLTTTLTKTGYIHSPYDHSLFTKRQGSEIVLILIYIDDLVITGSDTKLIDEAKFVIHDKFKVKDLGNLRYFLGIEVMRLDKGILLNQRKYFLELISKVGLSGAKLAPTPIKSNCKRTIVEYDNHIGHISDAELDDITGYQILIRKLIYLTITRPGTCFVVQVLSHFMQRPKQSHLDAALRILRYLKGSPGLGLFFPQRYTSTITVFCDSDWASCPNTRRSVKNYVVKLGDY
ncbi:putative deacetylvindoline O-acetyltransferase-like [Capsicum annuum]|nr:putative deacetylvindoline O-acetyltransferase-like [Capsicum annuum]